MIKIIDYGMGNCGSIRNMLRYLGAESEIISQPDGLENATAIILPGVGSFDHGVQHLIPFKEALERKVLEEKIPFLGICLGMQLLLNESEEGNSSGLGWIEGEVKRFDFSSAGLTKRLPIPHMGWNEVWSSGGEKLFNSAPDELDRFYFVHSYHATNVKKDNQLASCKYGYEFVCGIKKDNIYGVQFHPEKSHKFGKKLFADFIELSKC